MTPREEWREAWREAWRLARLGQRPSGPGAMLDAWLCRIDRMRPESILLVGMVRLRNPAEHRRYCREVLA